MALRPNSSMASSRYCVLLFLLFPPGNARPLREVFEVIFLYVFLYLVVGFLLGILHRKIYGRSDETMRALTIILFWPIIIVMFFCELLLIGLAEVSRLIDGLYDRISK